MERITANQLDRFGPIIQLLFRLSFPEGLSMDELREKAPGQGYLRRVLAGLEKEGR